MIDWIKWSLFALAIIVFAGIIVFVTTAFKKNCPSGQVFNDHIGRCIGECPSGQTRYPSGAEISECRQCPLDQDYDDVDKKCVPHTTRYQCDGRGNCAASATGQFADLAGCKRLCIDGCARCSRRCCSVGAQHGVPIFACCENADDECCGNGCCPKGWLCNSTTHQCINCKADQTCNALDANDPNILEVIPMRPFSST